MGNMTLENFRDELRFNLKNRAAGDGVTDARCNRWVNAAYFHMALPNVHDFREFHTSYDITLLLNTGTYSIAEAIVGDKVIAIRSVFHYLEAVSDTARKRRLYPRNIRYFDQRTITVGPTLSQYAIESEVLFVASIPDSTAAGQTLRIRYWRQPTRLSGDTDTTEIPDYYDEVLLLGTQWIAERHLGYGERAEKTKQDYVGLLNEGPESAQLEGEEWDFQVEVNPHSQMEALI